MAQKKPKSNGAVEKKLVGIADLVITAAQRSKDPTLSIPVRSLANVTFDEKRGLIEMGRRKQARTFFNVGMAKKFMQTVLVADALSELQRANLTTSLREIYYRTKHTIKDSHENTFDGVQMYVDDLVADESRRSKGIGKALMDHLQHLARDAGCENFNLDSGTQRQQAHRFYFREGMVITSFHFRKALRPSVSK